jgi:thiol-disulfide isomerase/thioredoxin
MKYIMKRITLITLLFIMGISVTSFAGDGYHIQVKMTDVKDSLIYLVHYYGKGRPTIFITDSTKLDHNGNATFDSKDPAFVGGIYIILIGDKDKTNFEFLLNKGDNMSITATKSKLPDGLKFKNSPENDRFLEYIEYLKGYSGEQDKLKKELDKARTKEDTDVVRKKSIASSKVLTKYRRDYVHAHPGTLLSSIFNAMETPEIPEGTHYLEDGKTKDSTYAYRYYKAHFWDGFDFKDDRLIYTPLYDPRIEEYFTKLVLPWPDSVEKESDILLKKAKGTKDMFHYTLWWLTRNAENSKVMGMDEVFVYLVENYYMKGDAFWLTNDELTKYLDRARKIAPNVIGNVAPEVKLPNVTTKKEESMIGMKAKYTLIIFYSPNCGHCQHEMPSIDSLYTSVLKSKGVKIFTVATEGDEKAINDFIVKYKMGEWTNTWNPDHTSHYHDDYDVYSTPTIYLLDDKKIIRGKRLDHANISNLIEMIEKKAKDKTTKGK